MDVFDSIDSRVLCNADLITLSQSYPAANDNESRLDISTAEQVTDNGIQELAARSDSWAATELACVTIAWFAFGRWTGAVLTGVCGR